MKEKYILGLDIGGTKCAVLLASVCNGVQLLDKIKFPTDAQKGYEQAKDRLLVAGQEILQRNGLKNSDLTAIGVSCGGPLDSKTGTILCPPNLPGWVNIPITSILEEAFGVPAFLQNDANACALVEWKLGAGKGCSDMIFLTMGTGFGGGVISGGHLLCGASDMGGEVGHIRLEEDGPVGFGKAGSVEGFCSGGGIAQQAKIYTQQKIAQGNPPAWTQAGIATEELDARIIGQYAEQGDPDAKAIYAQVGTYLGKALSIFIDAFNPQKIVIGSIFVRSEEMLRPAMEEVIAKETIPFSREVCQVVPAATGEQLGDLASILTACYGLDLDITPLEFPAEPEVLRHYERLFERYPAMASRREAVMAAYQTLRRCYENGNKLLLCGNGGSASDCAHIVGELMKGFFKKRPLNAVLTKAIGPLAEKLQSALPAIDLTQHTSLSTAYLNDVDPQMLFAQQVLGHGKPGDVLLGISTSGNSENIIKTAIVAKALGLTVIGLTGVGGGEMAALCDVLIDVPAKVTADVQELHLPVYHTLCAMLEATFFAE